MVMGVVLAMRRAARGEGLQAGGSGRGRAGRCAAVDTPCGEFPQATTFEHRFAINLSGVPYTSCRRRHSLSPSKVGAARLAQPSRFSAPMAPNVAPPVSPPHPCNDPHASSGKGRSQGEEGRRGREAEALALCRPGRPRLAVSPVRQPGRHAWRHAGTFRGGKSCPIGMGCLSPLARPLWSGFDMRCAFSCSFASFFEDDGRLQQLTLQSLSLASMDDELSRRIDAAAAGCRSRDPCQGETRSQRADGQCPLLCVRQAGAQARFVRH